MKRTVLNGNLLIYLGCLLIFSYCGKETQKSTQGGGEFYVKLTFDPPLNNGTTGESLVLGDNLGAKTWYGQNATAPLREIQTDPISVTAGQNLSITFQVINAHPNAENICRKVKLIGIQNLQPIKTYEFDLGIKFNSCKDYGQQIKNFIIK
jgi:hypothetical protein